jgi:hypothetical protein
MKITILMIKFLFVGALFILSNHNLHIGTHDELVLFGKMYYTWLGDVFDNGKAIAGYVVKSDWLPEVIELNESLPTEITSQSVTG